MFLDLVVQSLELLDRVSVSGFYLQLGQLLCGHFIYLLMEAVGL
jgi:hypothetical protein